MTKEEIIAQNEIIEVARRAGFIDYELDDGTTNAFDKRYKAFAKLVAKHTLLNTDPSSFMSYQEGVEVGRMAEREACAKIVEESSLPDTYSEACLLDIANEIRARGQE